MDAAVCEVLVPEQDVLYYILNVQLISVHTLCCNGYSHLWGILARTRRFILYTQCTIIVRTPALLMCI